MTRRFGSFFPWSIWLERLQIDDQHTRSRLLVSVRIHCYMNHVLLRQIQLMVHRMDESQEEDLSGVISKARAKISTKSLRTCVFSLSVLSLG